MSYDIIKSNYDKGMWTENMVALACTKGIITKEQYKEITGAEYAEQ